MGYITILLPMAHGSYNTSTLHGPWVIQYFYYPQVMGCTTILLAMAHGLYNIPDDVIIYHSQPINWQSRHSQFVGDWNTLENYLYYTCLSKYDYTTSVLHIGKVTPKPLQTQFLLSLPTYATCLFLLQHKLYALASHSHGSATFPPMLVLIHCHIIPVLLDLMLAYIGCMLQGHWQQNYQ